MELISQEAVRILYTCTFLFLFIVLDSDKQEVARSNQELVIHLTPTKNTLTFLQFRYGINNPSFFFQRHGNS